MNTQRKLPYVILLCLLLVAAPKLHAENECIDGQYVLTASNVSPKRADALQQMAAVSDAPVALAESDLHAVLVEAHTKNSGKRVVKELSSKNLCQRLKRHYRLEMLKKRRAHKAKIIRHYNCSCNALYKSSASPNDTYYYLEWGLKNSNSIDIDAEGAWQLHTGSSQVVVAIVDTGVDYTHPDLATNIWQNGNEIAGNGIDDDNDGVADDVHGFNTINNTGNPMDDNGHGTHVAGTIGALANNGTGVTGINWNVKILPVKFLDGNGSGSLFNAIKALDYVTLLKNRGVNIVLSNNSWGGGDYTQPLYDAIARARAAGLLFVAAAGNNSNDNDASPSYPASYNLDNVISVAAIDNNGNRASFSNFGATSVDIAAPGVNIASTYPGNRYVYLSGTSMATPHVSGALALLKAFQPALDMGALRDNLYANGRTLLTLQGVVATGKMVNVGNMLRAALAHPVVTAPVPSPTPAASATASPTPGAGSSIQNPGSTPTTTPTPAPGNWDVGGLVTSNNVGLGSVRLDLQINGTSYTRYTGTNGDFKFDKIAGPASYTLSLSKPGYNFNTVSGYLSADVYHAITATGRTFTLTFLIEQEDQSPVRGAAISVGTLGSGSSDASGTFSLTLPYGTIFSATASAYGYDFNQGALVGKIYGDVTRVFVAKPN